MSADLPKNRPSGGEMDTPSTPHRLGARNINQKQKEPAYASSPKSGVNLFSQSLPPPLQARTGSTDSVDGASGPFGASPKKPGVSQLVNVFDSTLRLAPTSPPAKPQPTPTKKLVNHTNEDSKMPEISTLRVDEKLGLKRRNNKENARPTLIREDTTATLPVISETGTAAPTTRKKYDPLRNLTVEEREKLAKPQVKRLANVAQLCMFESTGF